MPLHDDFVMGSTNISQEKVNNSICISKEKNKDIKLNKGRIAKNKKKYTFKNICEAKRLVSFTIINT